MHTLSVTGFVISYPRYQEIVQGEPVTNQLRIWRKIGLALGFIFMLAGCLGPATNTLRVRVLVDGQTLTLTAADTIPVSQLLDRNNIQLGELDRIEPPDFTLISDNMTVTIVRVIERVECRTETMPYDTQRYSIPDLPPGQTKVIEAGINGEAQVCYNVVYEDSQEKERNQSSRTILQQPKNQIVAVGIDSSQIEPRPITGVLIYLSGNDVRMIDGNTSQQRTLNTGGHVDGRVLALSEDGRNLLYTRYLDGLDSTGVCQQDNELWVLFNITDPNAQPVKIDVLSNVLTATWIPNQPFNFSYSTFTPRPTSPCFQALNDLTFARLDSNTGQLLGADVIITPQPLGPYGSWGTDFVWSPTGKLLAWAQPDGVGLVDIDKKVYLRLISFAPYTTTLTRQWLWKPTITWSPDGNILAAAVHGKPLTNEPAENSPAFDIALTQSLNQYGINPAIPKVGMWAAPRFSPIMQQGASVIGYLAYLQARSTNDPVSSEYDLVIADRDTSNPQTVFPGPDKPGLRPLDNGSDFAWSPDGTYLAVVYQGDIYLVDVTNGQATRATLVGNAQLPRWTR